MQKKQKTKNKQQSAVAKAEPARAFAVQDNSPRQPGGWFARVFGSMQQYGMPRREQGLSRAAAPPTHKDGDDRYLRLLAEMENLKKRVAREKEDLHRHALESFMKDLLPVLDSFEKGFGALKDDAALAQTAFVAGMRLVDEQLRKILAGHGLRAVSGCGEVFDPRVHQAISRQETQEVDTETVAEEFAKGYLLHDRLLRPALVSVCVPLPPHESGQD